MKGRVNCFLFIITNLFIFLFMSIGYASISSSNLRISGDAIAMVQDGIFISDAVCSSGGNVLGVTQTTLNSSVLLSSSDSLSTVTCTITLYNNSSVSYYYDDVFYDIDDSSFYSNTDIVPSVDINHGDEILSQEELVLHVTFGYDTGITPSSNNNSLTSYVIFRFVDTIVNDNLTLTDTILSLIDGKTHTNGVYDLGAGASGCTYKLAFDGTYNNTYQGTNDNNLRFVGSNPCNFVSIDNEKWRIIGVMNDAGSEPLVKLIAAEPYNNGNVVAYHNKGNTAIWTSATLYNTLSALAITNNSMVETLDYKNGGPANNTSTASEFYSSESSNMASSIKIGLMNVSDYGFATDNINACRSLQLNSWTNATNKANCVTNHNWLYLSTSNVLTMTLVNSYRQTFRLTYSGSPSASRPNDTGVVYPVIYLKSDVLVDSGNGDENTPYILK